MKIVAVPMAAVILFIMCADSATSTSMSVTAEEIFCDSCNSDEHTVYGPTEPPVWNGWGTSETAAIRDAQNEMRKSFQGVFDNVEEDYECEECQSLPPTCEKYWAPNYVNYWENATQAGPESWFGSVCALSAHLHVCCTECELW